MNGSGNVTNDLMVIVSLGVMGPTTILLESSSVLRRDNPILYFSRTKLLSPILLPLDVNTADFMSPRLSTIVVKSTPTCLSINVLALFSAPTSSNGVYNAAYLFWSELDSYNLNNSLI